MNTNNLIKRIENLEKNISKQSKTEVHRTSFLSRFGKSAFTKTSLAIGIAITVMMSSLFLYAAQHLFDAGDVISSQKINENFSDLYSLVPVGSIVAWHKTLEGTPGLSDKFVECNGQTLTDEASTYYGKVVPNLNGHPDGEDSPGLTAKTQMFLRGGVDSGIGQNYSTALPNNNFTTSTDGEHNHEDTVILAWGGGYWGIGGAAAGIGSHGSTTQNGNHSHHIDGGGDSETRPSNMSVVWIMRVK